MRRLQPQPKDRRKVPIPSDLRDSMREAFEMIREAKRDPDVVIDFDDAIQVGSICGGKVGTKLRPFEFTYYPEDDERGKWYLTLHRTEVEDIGDGHMTDITMYCCKSPDCRTKAREENEHCFYCDYVEETH